MPTLAEYLDEDVAANPTKGARGKQTSWLSVGTITSSSGKLLIVDPAFAPELESGLLLDCETGEYEIDAKVLDFGGDRRVSRLRAILRGAAPAKSKAAGEVFSDVARIGVCDFETFSAEWDKNPEKSEEKLETALDHSKPYGLFILNKKKQETCLLYVDSGFGDGTFPVKLLIETGRTVGFEVEFITPQKRYPLESGLIQREAEDKQSPKSKGKSTKEPNPFDEVFKGYKPTGNKQKDFEEKQRRVDIFMAQASADLLKDALNRNETLIKLRRSAPVLEMELRIEARTEWSPEELLKIAPLKTEGFEFTDRASSNLPGAFITIGFRSKDGIVAEVFSNEKGASLSLLVCAPNGEEMVFSDAQAAVGIAFPTWRSLSNHPGLEPSELLKKLLSRRTRRFVKKISSTQAVEIFKDGFRRLQAWRAARGGAKIEELKLQQHGKPAPEDPDWLFATWRQAAAEQWLYNWLKLQKGLPFEPSAVIESLVIIHDDLDPRLTRYCWTAATGMTRPSTMNFDSEPRRAAFTKVNEEFDHPLELVARKTKDYQADYYLPARRD